jgi:hypothetical protein
MLKAREIVSIVVIYTDRVFVNSRQLQCYSTVILSCVLHSSNKTRTQSHFSAFEFLCSPSCRTLRIRAHHELPVPFKLLTRDRPNVGINTSIANILLCNIVIDCNRAYHKVTSLLAVTISQVPCKHTGGQRKQQDTIMELPPLFCSLCSLFLSTTEVTVQAYHQ